jgi:hypothetical protein
MVFSLLESSFADLQMMIMDVMLKQKEKENTPPTDPKRKTDEWS